MILMSTSETPAPASAGPIAGGAAQVPGAASPVLRAAPTTAGTASTTGSAASAIDCREVRKAYGSTLALQGVSLTVPVGSVFGFLGPNGAGKSTLVKILVGLVRTTSGEAHVLGGRPGSRPVQRRVGYLPEQFRFPQWLSGRELLRFHSRLVDAPDEATALLDLTGIGAAGDRRIGGYSKGMQQRLGLAQALVGRPDVVFLDEPTSALDPLGRLEVRDVLLHLRERGVTVFLNSHLLTEVEKVCDRVAVIDRGRIVEQGLMEGLLQRPEAHIRVGMLAADAAAAFLTHLRARFPEAEPVYDAGVVAVPLAEPSQVPDLVKATVEYGLPVYEAGLVRRSLEDAFVQLVGRPKEDDQA
jgi:ABC-2 type transport system ATP-binding protein